MKHISLQVQEEIKHILPDTLEKDLQDNEIICPICHGLGVIKRHLPFGLREEENDQYSKINWFDNEYLTFCPDCFNGVVRLCEYCGKPIKKGFINQCDCEEYKNKEAEQTARKYQDRIDNATEIKPEDTVEWLYDDVHDKYYEDIGEFIDSFELDYDYLEEELLDELPQILWVCYQQKIAIDADSVIETACDELHEDANENCDYKELQKLLDAWCEKQSGTTTIYPEYKQYIKVDKNWFTGKEK